MLLGEDHGQKMVGILLAGAMIFILGIVDDLHVLRPWFKLLGQIAAALVLVFFGMRTFFTCTMCFLLPLLPCSGSCLL